MYFEIPIVTRMCLCFPLRVGLLTWSYIRVISSVFSFWQLIVYAETLNSKEVYTPPLSTVYLALFICVAIADFAFTWLFIIGLHLKSYDFISCYYGYNVTLLIVSILGSIWYIWSNLRQAWHLLLDPEYLFVWKIMLLICIVLLFIIFVNMYCLIMTKAVMKKYKGAHNLTVRHEVEDDDDQNEILSQQCENYEVV